MRVVVIGHNGLLGCTLLPVLRSAGHEVLGVARSGDAHWNGDLARPDEALRALDALRPESIVNLAGLTNVDDCEKSPHQAYLANVRVVENVADWVRQQGGQCHLVHISTDQVYDGPGLHAETDVTLTNVYSFSKYAGELAAATVPSTVLRTNFFGPSECPRRRSFSDWLADSLRIGKSLTLFTDVYFSPLSMQTLARLVSVVVAKPVKGVFNLGSHDGVSKAEFAYAFARMLALPEDLMCTGTIAEATLAAYRPRNMCMDCTKFERAFGVTLPMLAQEILSTKGAYAHET